MTVAKPFKGTKVSHCMKGRQPSGARRKPVSKRGMIVTIDPSIIRPGYSVEEMLTNERLGGASIRVASKEYHAAVGMGDGTQIDQNMLKVGRGEA
jgi:hypothetical protein